MTRGHLEKGLVSLKDEFAGVFGAETIERYMTEAIGDLPGGQDLRTSFPCPSIASRASARALATG